MYASIHSGQKWALDPLERELPGVTAQQFGADKVSKNSGPLQEHQVLLTTEPCLQPLRFEAFLFYFIFAFLLHPSYHSTCE